jgi:hypothetical protein
LRRRAELDVADPVMFNMTGSEVILESYFAAASVGMLSGVVL